MSSFVAIENNSRFADGFAIPNLNVGRASKGFLELVLFMFNIDSNHGFMVSYDVVKERMLSRLMGWQQMKYEKL